MKFLNMITEWMNDRPRIRSLVRGLYYFIREHYDPYPYRRAFKKNKLIFVHVPKNGGTSVLSVLGVKPGDHCTYRQYQQANPIRYQYYKSFAILRNPEERFLSAYYYMKSGGNGTSDRLVSERYFQEGDVNYFVENIFDSQFAHAVGVFRPQFIFVADVFGEVQVNYLLDLCKLDKGIQRLNQSCKTKFPVPGVLNKSVKDSAVLTEGSKEKLGVIYSRDYELYSRISSLEDGFLERS